MRKFFILSLFFFGQYGQCAYPESYSQSREQFLNLSKSLQKDDPRIEIHEYKIPHEKDDSLYIDVLYIPPREKKHRLLLLTSGVHGVEAFTGSYILQDVLTYHFNHLPNDNMGILMIHNLNPFGMKYGRRTNKDNVDLNRSFLSDRRRESLENKDYADLESFINPKGPLGSIYWNMFTGSLEALWLKLKYGDKKLRQAILAGQYAYPQGIYFGGEEAQPSHSYIKNLIDNILNNYEYILHLDLHTGYGERGVMHLFGPAKLPHLNSKLTNVIFKGFKIESGNTKDFYSVNGDFTAFVMNSVKKGTHVIPMTLEFGTLDSQTLKGALLSLHNARLENQAHFYGTKNIETKNDIQARFREQFDPSDPHWRKQVLLEFRKSFPVFIKRFNQIVPWKR